MSDLSDAEIVRLGSEAYVFGYPLVLMQLTKLNLSKEPNKFHHMFKTPDHNFRQVVKPNNDTLYSTAFLDLTAGPVVVSVPDTNGRYYLIQCMDAWSNVFESIGTRTTGNKEGHFAFCGPSFKGTLTGAPKNVTRVDCPTSMAWLIGRAQLNGPDDVPAVNAMQRKLGMTKWEAFVAGKVDTEGLDAFALPKKGEPKEEVADMSASKFFGTLAELMKDNPPAPADAAMEADLKKLGIVAGEPFKPSDHVLRVLSEESIPTGKKKLGELPGEPPKHSNGWINAEETFPIGSYGKDYHARAFIALLGFGANLRQDAVYPMLNRDSEGRPLSTLADGAEAPLVAYKLHFPLGTIPPVQAFWSLTLYDAADYLSENPINRFCIGDRDKLEYAADGSLTLTISHEAPKDQPQANWLPAPKGVFSIVLRLYWPKQSVVDGLWTPPPLVRA